MFETIIIGVAISFLTQVAKKFNLDPRLLAAFLSLLGATTFLVVQRVVPEEMVTQFSEFAIVAWGTSSLFYEVIIKELKVYMPKG